MIYKDIEKIQPWPDETDYVPILRSWQSQREGLEMLSISKTKYRVIVWRIAFRRNASVPWMAGFFHKFNLTENIKLYKEINNPL